MNVRTAPRMDKEAFWTWLAGQDRRHELVDGLPVMQPFVTRRHALVASATAFALMQRLDLRAFDVTIGDFAVETGERSVRYADVMVERTGGCAAERSTRDALLLVEVLSPSTLEVDQGPKLVEYLGLPRLGTYLICAQDERRVIAWTRDGAGSWPGMPVTVTGHGAIVDVPVLGLSLPLDSIYATAFR